MNKKITIVLYVLGIVITAGNFCLADLIPVDVRFCSAERSILGTPPASCNAVERCRVNLSSVRSSFSNGREEKVGSLKCQNNCTSSDGTPDSYSVEREFTLGYTVNELWQNSSTYQFGVGPKPVGASYQYVTTVGASTGTSASKSVKVTEPLTVSAKAHKKVCKQHYVKLVDFRYERDYNYQYTRVDRTEGGPGCSCYAGSGYNCVNITVSSGTVTATGTKDEEEWTTITETDAVGCDGGGA